MYIIPGKYVRIFFGWEVLYFLHFPVLSYMIENWFAILKKEKRKIQRCDEHSKLNVEKQTCEDK